MGSKRLLYTERERGSPVGTGYSSGRRPLGMRKESTRPKDLRSIRFQKKKKKSRDREAFTMPSRDEWKGPRPIFAENVEGFSLRRSAVNCDRASSN